MQLRLLPALTDHADAALKGTVATTAERIESRQEFLDALLTGRARGADLAELLGE